MPSRYDSFVIFSIYIIAGNLPPIYLLNRKLMEIDYLNTEVFMFSNRKPIMVLTAVNGS